MSNMNIQRDWRGEINVLLIPFILIVLVLFGVGGFAYWAYSGRQDYKNNVDEKIVAAVRVANDKLSSQKEAEFAQREKNPLKTYVGPSAFGSLRVQYPKTWSAYVSVSDTSNLPLDGYFYPNVVPATTGANATNFALRVQVTTQSYDSILQNFQALIQAKSVTVKPFSMPKEPNVVGVKVTGQIQPQKEGTMIVLPVRNQTVEVWTESPAYQSDFDKIITPNFNFSP